MNGITEPAAQAPSPATAARLPWTTRWAIAAARARRWEFWPAWLFYLPIVVWILWLGLRHRAPTLFTAANPAIDNGGVVGERKHPLLAALQARAPDLVASFELLPPGPLAPRLGQALHCAGRWGYPVVLKPDVGARGRAVRIVRSAEALRDYLQVHTAAVIVQRYVHGEEYGVFIARLPGEATVRLLSIVRKTFPAVTGDGRRRLRDLILDDARGFLIAPTLLARWADRLDEVPAAGERRTLVEIGSHCRGSLFLDATALATPALARTLTRLADAVPGYDFGRIDLRVPDAASLQAGTGLQALELNGVTAESAHIYHPGTPLLEGYRAMFRQWSLAFAIGAHHARRGAPVTPARELWRCWREDLARADDR